MRPCPQAPCSSPRTRSRARSPPPRSPSAIAAGVRDGGREAVELPIGDGGEGTLEVARRRAWRHLADGDRQRPARPPARGRYGLLPDGRGVVEMAQASGLGSSPRASATPGPRRRGGTGELIAAAVAAGAATVIVTVGGSATTDGGAGALAALDEADVESRAGGRLRRPHSVGGRRRGSSGRRRAPTRRWSRRLEERLDDLAATAPRDPRGVPMTGCAGGLSGGLYAFRGATLVPGAAYVLDAIGFDARLRDAAFTVTGEGALDAQTLAGKAVGEVAVRCRDAGVAVPRSGRRSDLDDATASPSSGCRACGRPRRSRSFAPPGRKLAAASSGRPRAPRSRRRKSYAGRVRNSTKSSASATSSKSAREARRAALGVEPLVVADLGPDALELLVLGLAHELGRDRAAVVELGPVADPLPHLRARRSRPSPRPPSARRSPRRRCRAARTRCTGCRR